MRKNLRWKLIFISSVTVACILGITGLPPSWNNVKERIRLGLDLRGGIHLVLQVVTDDAVNIETDQAVERIKDELRSRQVSFAEVRKRDQRTIEIREIDPQKHSEVRGIIDDYFQYWNRSTLSDAPNSYLLTLKPNVKSQS